jgi:hypothetical protein
LSRRRAFRFLLVPLRECSIDPLQLSKHPPPACAKGADAFTLPLRRLWLCRPFDHSACNSLISTVMDNQSNTSAGPSANEPVDSVHQDTGRAMLPRLHVEVA